MGGVGGVGGFWGLNLYLVCWVTSDFFGEWGPRQLEGRVAIFANVLLRKNGCLDMTMEMDFLW